MSELQQGTETTKGPSMKEELLASLDDLMSALRAVTGGDLEVRLPVTFPETHPVGALTVSANAMIEALVEARGHADSYSRNLADQIATIERQQVAIQELSTPIIEVWPGVLCIPVVGMLDSDRATEMT